VDTARLTRGMQLPKSPAHIAEKRFLVSIHDVNPRFECEIEALRDLLAEHALTRRVAMLVVPDYWNRAPITRSSPFAAKLRAWSDAGIEMFVHGWSHRDDTAHRGTFTSLKARYMTAREGEFLGLDTATCTQRMVAGKALIEDIIGREVAGFVAPAWLYGPDARAALATSGFALAEDHFSVWRPATGEVLCTGPVITWASRSPARTASSILAASLLTPALRAASTVRVAVHPGDVHVRAIRRSIHRTLLSLRQSRSAGRYADLLDPPRGPRKGGSMPAPSWP